MIKNVISKRTRLYVKKPQRYNLKKIFSYSYGSYKTKLSDYLQKI